MKKTLRISVGISAFNEAARIGKVLSDLRAQSQKGWEFESVKVYCDGCTDDTAAMARNENWSKVVVIEDQTRKGKTARLQQIFQESHGDLIVLLDADIRIKQKNMISELTRPFAESKVVLTGGNSRPFEPHSFIEKAVFSSFQVFDSSRQWHNGGDNVFGCTGSCMAIRNSVAKLVRLPTNLINEDAYIYFFCTELGIFKYCERAVVEYSLPKNSRDYIKQVLRSEPTVVKLELYPYFGDRLNYELRRSFFHYIFYIGKVWVKNPVGVSYLMFLNSMCLPFFRIVLKHYNINWFTAHSTKVAQ